MCVCVYLCYYKGTTRLCYHCGLPYESEKLSKYRLIDLNSAIVHFETVTRVRIALNDFDDIV